MSESVSDLLLSSHTSTIRREVRVNLLEQQPLQTSSQNTMGAAKVQTQEELLSGRFGDASNAAAVAAAVAASAPLIKVNLSHS